MTEITGTNTSLLFTVTRKTPELVPPAIPTPYEFKDISDIDDQDDFRFKTPMILIYKNNNNARQIDFATVLKIAISQALVSYYPFAGRLRETTSGTWVVECNGEGVMFVEGDANVTLDDFGVNLYPPFPCIDELLCNVPGSDVTLGSPLLFFQVTRLRCGGCILAIRLTHAIADALGLTQFMTAISELTNGAQSLSIQPVWQRHLLKARDPLRVTCVHHELDVLQDYARTIVPPDELVHKCFFFGPDDEITTIQHSIPPHMKPASSFEIITACLWRCHTVALGLNKDEEVRLRFIMNIRSKVDPPLLPGYYGNAVISPVAISKVGLLSNNPISYAVGLLKNAKAEVTSEYIKSFIDYMIRKDRVGCTVARTYLVSDSSRLGFSGLDFGWGPPVYGGPGKNWVGPMPAVGCYYAACSNYKGKSGTIVPLGLPRPIMDKFTKEMSRVISGFSDYPVASRCNATHRGINRVNQMGYRSGHGRSGSHIGFRSYRIHSRFVSVYIGSLVGRVIIG